jgi:hypothetical protein
MSDKKEKEENLNDNKPYRVEKNMEERIKELEKQVEVLKRLLILALNQVDCEDYVSDIYEMKKLVRKDDCVNE